MAYTQDNRLIAIDTPLGKDALLLTGCHGIEGISGLFSFELNLLSENHNITFEDIIGKNVTVSIILADGDKRFFNGIISSFSQGRGGGEAGGDPHFSHYTATMVPWLWLLTRTADSRIFQKLSVPDIVEKIFTEKGFLDYKLLLNDSYDKRDYCVQYRETDFNFVSRLLEEEGICYLFEHDEEKHTLILADASDKFKPCPKQESARYQISAGGWLEEDVITSLDKMQEIRPAKYTINDFNFEIPSTDMKVDVSTKQMLGPGEREIYDYPGLYTKKAQGERLTTIRMEEEETKITTITGSSDCRAFTSGYRFDLLEYFREDMNNKPYVLVSVNHGATEPLGGSGQESGQSYANSFTCIPFDVPCRPPRLTPKPVVEGAQTAIVVGPAGEEIYTDEHGRVKVQFHWDREGKKDENSSCWIRVSQVWAGAGWGAMHIPRIGQEVIVDFLEGDPDRPIITGRVYHGTNTPPYSLPDEKTKSTIKSDSSLGGGGSNEIRFEDKKGEEEIYLHER
ncbi:MAG: type VI secretion system tip protein VgrG [Deltaproteobacteria bacterium]|nr:type VI secretion system tip protein VgrG [Deltaproteobacteria bacterium]